ncbi:MAG: transcriptional repressor NrdR [Clostridia bacterium]|nr:transcriptional repressor NrdR [Clostridia bacterium]MBQ7751672.1 transcriptional repressor NrdR [Clostridia bacterium]
MKCPYCGFMESKVIDSRPADDGTSIRRRRECLKCQKRFTTYEKLETISLVVVKQDNSRQPYDREKIVRGLIRACEKRPITYAQMEDIADQIESELYQMMSKEVTSTEIGEKVMSHLKELDEVAYVRFASVHKHFSNIQSFKSALEELLDEK